MCQSLLAFCSGLLWAGSLSGSFQDSETLCLSYSILRLQVLTCKWASCLQGSLRATDQNVVTRSVPNPKVCSSTLGRCNFRRHLGWLTSHLLATQCGITASRGPTGLAPWELVTRKSVTLGVGGSLGSGLSDTLLKVGLGAAHDRCG